MKIIKWHDDSYINAIKKSIGYNPCSANLTLMNKGNYLQRRFALSALFLTMYNLSIEKSGLLFIKRKKYSPVLVAHIVTYIAFNDIKKIDLNKKIGRIELHIHTLMDDKKRVFSMSPKGGKYFPWQETSIIELKNLVSQFSE
ncbi:hypothetical protein [Pseudolactococcus piscium]|nr:hypothetical protein [Lactococcus piscium]